MIARVFHKVPVDFKQMMQTITGKPLQDQPNKIAFDDIRTGDYLEMGGQTVVFQVFDE